MDQRVPVVVRATCPHGRSAVTTALRDRADVHLVDQPAEPGCVRIAVSDTVAEAAQLFGRSTGPMLVVAEKFTAAGMLSAVASGAVAMVRRRELTPDRLAAAVVAMAGGPRRKAVPDVTLTPRQLSILRLIGDGYDNAQIATELCCSPHTVKNVIYELMAQLQVRNRVHAAAFAVRAGLI